MSPTARIVLFFVLLPAALGDIKDPKRMADEDGYFKREHSLVRPYQGRGMEVGEGFASNSLFGLFLLDSVLGIRRCHSGEPRLHQTNA